VKQNLKDRDWERVLEPRRDSGDVYTIRFTPLLLFCATVCLVVTAIMWANYRRDAAEREVQLRREHLQAQFDVEIQRISDRARTDFEINQIKDRLAILKYNENKTRADSAEARDNRTP